MSGDNLTTAQRRAAETLATSGDLEAAAETAGVSDRTLRRWRARPAFVAEVRHAARAQHHEAASRAVALAGAAVDVLAAVLSDTRAPAAVRVQAASKVLHLAVQIDADDLSIRLTQLEERLQ